MAKPKKPSNPKKSTVANRPYGEDRRPQRNPDADPVKVHRAYVERQLGGGATATPKAYARAIEQWNRLPGAVRGPSTELRAPPEEPAPPKASETEPAADNDSGEESHS